MDNNKFRFGKCVHGGFCKGDPEDVDFDHSACEGMNIHLGNPEDVDNGDPDACDFIFDCTIAESVFNGQAPCGLCGGAGAMTVDNWQYDITVMYVRCMQCDNEGPP